MAEVISNKELSMRNIFKKIVESKFQELEDKISQEINDDLKLVVTLTLEVIKRKVAFVKKLEDETTDICETKNNQNNLLSKVQTTKYTQNQTSLDSQDF